jgi:hypothetical protein
MVVALGAASSVIDQLKSFAPGRSSAQGRGFSLIPSESAEAQISGLPSSGSGAPAQTLSLGTIQSLLATQADDDTAVGQLVVLKNLNSATTTNSDGSTTTSITFDDGHTVAYAAPAKDAPANLPNQYIDQFIQPEGPVNPEPIPLPVPEYWTDVRPGR